MSTSEKKEKAAKLRLFLFVSDEDSEMSKK